MENLRLKLDQATAFFMVLTTIMLKSAVNHTGLLRSLNILVMIANWHFQFSDITLRLLCMGAGMIFLHKGRLGDLFYWVNKGCEMNTADLRKILDEHKIWIESFRENGLRAYLCGADLRGANLRDANLRGANLRDANLCGADLPDHTFVIMGNKYPITITNGEYVRAGCQNHTVEEWRKYSKQEIADMDGRSALRFYPKLLDIIDFYLGKGERPDWIKEPSEETEAA